MNVITWVSEKLVRRMVVPFVLFSVLTSILSVSLIYHNAKALHEEAVLSRLRVEVDLYEAQMNHWIEDQKKSVLFLSKTSLVRDKFSKLLSHSIDHPGYEQNYQELFDYLLAYSKDFPDLREIMVLSNDEGEILLSTKPDHEGASLSGEAFFQRGKEGLFVQGVYTIRGSNEPTLTIAGPLFDGAEKQQGILAVHLQLDRIDEVFRGVLGLDQTGEIYMVDKYKRFITADHLGRHDSKGVTQAVVGREGGGAYLNYAGAPVVGYQRWLPELEIGLFAEIGQFEAFSPARRLGEWIAGITIVIASLSIAWIVFVAQRITAPLLRQAEEGSSQSKEKMQLLIDRMPIACITWNADFTVDLWNPAAENVFGYNERDVIGKHAFELIVPAEIKPLVASIWQRLMDGDETAHSENKNVTKDGRTIVCDWYNTPLKNDQGESIGAISMVHDVTDKNLTEEEARHKTELLQIIMDTIPAPIFFKDVDGIYQECNAAFAEFLGLEYAQVVGHSVYDIAPAEKAAIYEAADRKLLELGGRQSYEAKVRYADGTDRDVVFHKAVFTDLGGDVAGMVGAMLDVSDIKSAQSALTESERSYREIFNASSEAIFVRDFESGKIVDVNRAMLEMYGYTYKEVLALSVSDLTSDDMPSATNLIKKYIAGAKSGIPQLFEWRSVRKDGTPLWVEIALKKSEILGKNCLLSVVRNIEDRKRSETALIESEERFRHLVENAADALILHDSLGQIVAVNQRCCDRLGYRREELLTMTVFQIVSGVDVDELLATWKRDISGQSRSFERAHVRKDGSTYPVEVNVVSYDSHGRRLYIAVARDVSERKRQGAELAKYRSQLEKLVSERTQQLEDAQHELVANERLAVLGQLTATVSHELRNPLGTVKNAIYLLGRLKDTHNPEKVEKALDLADRNVRRCDNIINELLDFTRQQEGESAEIDLGVWVQTVLDDQTLPADIVLKTDLPPGVVVLANPERLRRAFVNVFSNAIQAFDGRDNNHKFLSIALSTDEQRIQIVVTDNGSGISDEVLPRIFEPMFSTKNFGVGLGMAIVKNIMEEQGGGVELTSQPGEGTIVSLWLPQRQNLPVMPSTSHGENNYNI